ncbi:MAG: hypothetical protein CM1200mP30_12320 [Pseudomonadota bacterium]|nr:MAG: hypothetical protein CM1200mP30_12320 [Pseudomonadota bacterium]
MLTSHPIAMQHILTAKEENKAQIIVADPRFTQTQHLLINLSISFRYGCGLIYGLLSYLENGWEDKSMINDRTYGFSDLKKELSAMILRLFLTLQGCLLKI